MNQNIEQQYSVLLSGYLPRDNWGQRKCPGLRQRWDVRFSKRHWKGLDPNLSVATLYSTPFQWMGLETSSVIWKWSALPTSTGWDCGLQCLLSFCASRIICNPPSDATIRTMAETESNLASQEQPENSSRGSQVRISFQSELAESEYPSQLCQGNRQGILALFWFTSKQLLVWYDYKGHWVRHAS